MSGSAEQDPAELAPLRARESSIVWIRWGGIGFGLVEMMLEPPLARPLGYATVAVLAAANLLIARANGRTATARAQRALGLVALALDLLALLDFTYLYTFEEYGSTWLILYLAPLEAALRFGFGGTLASAAVVSLLYLPRELYRQAAFGFAFSAPSVAFRLGVLWIVALFAGATARQLARERDEARQLATERSALLEQLRRADHLKADFVATVGHELRTPLAILTGFTELLQMRLSQLTAEQQRQYLSEMAKAGRRLTQRIEALLDFAALEGSPLRLERRPVHLGSVVREAAELYGEAARQAGMALTCEVDDGLVVVADEMRLRAALGYLLDNAIKFNRPRGTLTLRAARSDAGAVLAVADSGVGISAAEREAIFAPFGRARADDGPLYGGQGLGLTLGHRIVEAHGGRIEVDSEPGVGSTFRIVLPEAALTGGEASTSPRVSGRET